MAILNNSNAISSGGYDINNSLRLRASASAYLNRTFVTGSGTTSTFSAWVKRGTLGSVSPIMFVSPNSTEDAGLQFDSNNNLSFSSWNGAGGRPLGQLITTQVFRDPSAWYHIVLVVDTTQATSSNRLKLYVNGNQVTAFGTATYPSQNATHYWNLAYQHRLGRYAEAAGTNYLDGYLTEVNFIDGQALTPSSFGETDTTTGSWKPKAYTGTYGTNGFYLKFSDIATTSGSNAGLGKDFSGNANYWNTNNISVTAGVTYDAMIDSPTLTSATVANYAVLNPLDKNFGNAGSIVDGNLGTTSQTASVPSTFYLSTGKWYFEASFSSITGASSLVEVGIRNGTSATGQIQGYKSDGNKDVETSATAYGATYTTGDIIGCAFDLDAKSMTFYKNGTSQGSFTYTTVDLYTPCLIARGTTTYTGTINFGQRPFAYTPPTGFVRLNTFNLPTPTILQGNKYMDATLYTGTGTTNVIVTQSQFKPDLTWFKGRGNAENHALFDTVRGVNKNLAPNTTIAEGTQTDMLMAFNSNGFTLGADGNQQVNKAATTFVSWNWQAGQGSTSSNTSGSITSTVSVNATAGFSIVTYTGTGANATVGHGLGVAPRMIIVKRRNNGTDNWRVYHASIGAGNTLALNSTNASASSSVTWNNTAPTSTVFSVGTESNTNASGSTIVAYCWAAIPGYSAFTSYTGNGSTDGPFIFLGFRPKFLMWKRTDTTSNWNIEDSYREAYNSATSPNELYANLSNAEGTNGSPIFLSNGFKLTSTGAGYNASGGTYIYMAFAENPFKNSLAR